MKYRYGKRLRNALKFGATFCRFYLLDITMALAVLLRPMSTGVKQFMTELRAFIDSCGNQSIAARKLRISPQFLCDLLMARRPIPSKVADRLGYDWVLQKRATK